jgi:glyoxylase-like metal-dependent hydrolase (beta-lactamase superfamily II)
MQARLKMKELRLLRESVPKIGELTEVAPGILWLRLPLPYALDHVNIYLIEDGTGWAAIDTGINSPNTRAIWESILDDQLGGRRLTRVIVTHFHPDHVGLAGWLTERFGLRLFMSAMEYFVCLSRQLDQSPQRIAAYREFYLRGGLPESRAAEIVNVGQGYPKATTPLPPAYFRLAHHDRLRIGGRAFEIITGGGHAFDQVMLYSASDRLFFSADQILARISPNVTVWPVEPEADSLGAYLRSLESLKKTLLEDALVLPGHNSPFYGVRARIEQLQQHHRDRCAEIAESCQVVPKTVAELTSVVFHRPLDGHQMSFAFGEMAAHVNHLVSRGILEYERGRFRTIALSPNSEIDL